MDSYDKDDFEEIIMDGLGIGYFDQSGQFQYGDDPRELQADLDFLANSEAFDPFDKHER